MPIPSNISKQVLTIGLAYKNPRGGIGSVIHTYSGYFDPFQFVSTYRPQRFKIFIFPYFFAACLKLCGILATRPRIKIVHIHGAAKGSLVRKYIVYLLSKKIFRKKVIYHSHGSELAEFYNNAAPLAKKFIRRFFEGTDRLICLSTQWEAFFTGHFHIKQVAILENIVENPGRVPKYLPMEDEPVKFLFLGALGERKGIFDLLAVLAGEQAKFRGKIVLTIGGSGETKRLNEYIREWNLGDLVRFEGWVEGDQKRLLLRQSDVYILPSYNEGLPISILEALSYNLPVISTPVGGIPEVVKNNENGFLVQAGDKQALSRAMEWFISHKADIAEMGRKSAEIVTPYYASRVIPKLTGIYAQLLEEK